MKSDALIADEDLAHRALLREVMRSMGISVAEAADGEDAGKYCAEKKPAMCIMSVSLPGWSRDLVRRIKRISPETRMVLAINQSDSMLSTIDAIQAGAERNYLTKPYRRDEIENIVEKIVQTGRR